MLAIELGILLVANLLSKEIKFKGDNIILFYTLKIVPFKSVQQKYSKFVKYVSNVTFSIV